MLIIIGCHISVPILTFNADLSIFSSTKVPLFPLTNCRNRINYVLTKTSAPKVVIIVCLHVVRTITVLVENELFPWASAGFSRLSGEVTSK